MLKRYLITLTIFLAPVLVMPTAVSAVDIVNNRICNKNAQSKDSTVCTDKKLGGANPLFGEGGILTIIINLLSIAVAMVAVITIIFAGLKYVTSGSNPEEVKSARERIIYALVALAIVAVAQSIVKYVVNNAIT